MLLDIQQLMEMTDRLSPELDGDGLFRILSSLNLSGKLYDFLDSVGYSHLFPKDGMAPSCVGDHYTNGTIIVIGASEVKANVLLAVAKECGFRKDRFDLNLDYYDSVKYDFNKTRRNSKYALVMFGSVPHSGMAKQDAGSVISKLETPGAGYPPVIRLGSNCLKITKSNFAESLEYAVTQGWITRDFAV